MASSAVLPAAVAAKPKRPVTERIRDLWPDIWALVRPRRKLLFVGFLLIIVSRLCGLVLPASTRYLIDDVIGKHNPALLLRLVFAVFAATAIEVVASFSVTPILSIEA